MKDSFGARLRFFRSKAGLSQQQLADKAGLSRKIISDYEVKLDVMPRETNLYKIADVLGIDSSNLVPKTTSEDTFKKTDDGMYEYKININELPREAVAALRDIAKIKNLTTNEAFEYIAKQAILGAFESYKKNEPKEPRVKGLKEVYVHEDEFINHLKKAP